MSRYEQHIPDGTEVRVDRYAKNWQSNTVPNVLKNKHGKVMSFDSQDNSYFIVGESENAWVKTGNIAPINGWSSIKSTEDKPELVVRVDAFADERVYRVAGRDNGAAPKGRVWIIDNARHNDPAHIGFLRYENEIAPYVAPPTVWEPDAEYLFLHESWIVTAVDDAGNALLKHVTPDGTASIRAAAASEINQATKKA